MAEGGVTTKPENGEGGIRPGHPGHNRPSGRHFSTEERAEFFQRLGYQPNELQQRLHAALETHRFIYASFPYQRGLTTALLHEALYRAESSGRDVLVCAPNNISRSLDWTPRLRELLAPPAACAGKLYYGRELRLQDGGRLFVLTPDEASTMARGWKLAAAFCDDASFGGEWNWRDLAPALCELGGPAVVGVSTQRPGFSAHTLWPDWWRKIMAAAQKEGESAGEKADKSYAEVLA